jgi:hypothetical protein
VASTIDVRWTVDVDYFVELTNRVPYNTGSLTEEQATELKKLYGGATHET